LNSAFSRKQCCNFRGEGERGRGRVVEKRSEVGGGGQLGFKDC